MEPYRTGSGGAHREEETFPPARCGVRTGTVAEFVRSVQGEEGYPRAAASVSSRSLQMVSASSCRRVTRSPSQSSSSRVIS